MAYFRTPAEALHLAVQTSPHQWDPLNDNRPVLQHAGSQLGIRDPFIFRDRDGHFHLLATGGNPADVLHASSADLLDWSSIQTIPVMGAISNARNAWAPECFWDRACQCYRIIWSSSVTANNGPDDWNHRIWSCTTSDFHRFSESAIWFDPGYSVIDATVYAATDGDYLVYKDERGDNQTGTNYKWLCTAVRPLAAPTFQQPHVRVSPPLVEGPILFRDERRWCIYYDCFMQGCWGAITSEDFVHWTPLHNISSPAGARHGSIIELPPSLAKPLMVHQW